MAKVIYFTYAPKSKYLRFYYRPQRAIDGVIVKDEKKSFVYFSTPHRKIKESLKVINEHFELKDCEVSESLDDLFYFLHKPNVVDTCSSSLSLLGNLSKAQLLARS